MNRILKNSAILLGSLAVLSGCIKETFPEGGYATSGQVSESPFAADGVIVSIPTTLITNYVGIGEHFDFGYPGIFGCTDRLAGEVFPVTQNMPGGNQYYDRWQAYMYTDNSTGMSATGYGPEFIWINYYQFIKSANDVVGQAGDSEANAEMRGVAKTFRALYYLDLARMYDPLPAKAGKGGYEAAVSNPAIQGLTVPLVTESSTLDDLKNNPRLPREEMFKFIFSDLDDAEACLADYKPATKNLPSLAVVYGLKARAYLWLGGFSETYAGVPTGEAAYKLAAEYARKAIDTSGAVAMTQAQWLDKTTGFNTVNNAWLWAMIQSTDTVLNNLLSFTAHIALESLWGYGRLSQPGISVFSYNRMSNGDWRQLAFVDANHTYSRMAPYTNLTEDEWNDVTQEMGVAVAPYASNKFHANQGEKVDYNIGNVTSIPLMRVEEMLLTEAEALAHYDSSAAVAKIKDFMATRGVANYNPPTGADALAEEIVFQKRIELWGEGLAFYDMKRLNIGLINGNPGTNAPNGDCFTTDGRAPWWNLVIPLSAVQQNAALQNGALNNPDPCKSYDSKNDNRVTTE